MYFSSRGSQGIPLLDLSKLDNADDPAFSAESIGTPGKVQKVQIRFIVREYHVRSPDKMVTLFEPTGCVDICSTYVPRQVTIKTRTNVVTTKRLAEFVQKEIREVYEVVSTMSISGCVLINDACSDSPSVTDRRKYWESRELSWVTFSWSGSSLCRRVV